MELKELKDMIEPVENWEYELSGTRQVGKSYMQNLLNNKNKVINDLLKRISDLEFEVERLEKRVEQEKRIVDIKDKDIVRLYERIDKAIEVLDIYGTSNYETADLLYSALRGSDKE